MLSVKLWACLLDLGIEGHHHRRLVSPVPSESRGRPWRAAWKRRSIRRDDTPFRLDCFEFRPRWEVWHLGDWGDQAPGQATLLTRFCDSTRALLIWLEAWHHPEWRDQAPDQTTLILWLLKMSPLNLRFRSKRTLWAEYLKHTWGPPTWMATDMDKHRAIDPKSFDNIYTTHILVCLDRFWMTLCVVENQYSPETNSGSNGATRWLRVYN